MDSSDSDFSEEESQFIPPQKTTVSSKKVVVGKKHLTDLKNILGLDAYQAKLEKKRLKRQNAKARKKGLALASGDGIQTKASISLGITSAPEVVTFIDHKKRNRKEEGLNQEKAINNNKDSSETQRKSKEITLKDARFEVFKFGVSGMDKKSKEEANKALAVRLGAKPEKNKCIEYKQLKEDRLAEKEDARIKEEERQQSLQGVRKKSGKSNVPKKSTKVSKKKGSKSDFKVGTFDGGMLKLSSKELKSVKAKR